MKIRVVEITRDLAVQNHDHEADVVEAESSDGELRVTLRDPDNRVTGWTLYAAGHWLSAALLEPMAEDVARYRKQVAERDRTTGNGGRGFTSPGGNSGPQ